MWQNTASFFILIALWFKCEVMISSEDKNVSNEDRGGFELTFTSKTPLHSRNCKLNNPNLKIRPQFGTSYA